MFLPTSSNPLPLIFHVLSELQAGKGREGTGVSSWQGNKGQPGGQKLPQIGTCTSLVLYPPLSTVPKVEWKAESHLIHAAGELCSTLNQEIAERQGMLQLLFPSLLMHFQQRRVGSR